MKKGQQINPVVSPMKNKFIYYLILAKFNIWHVLLFHLLFTDPSFKYLEDFITQNDLHLYQQQFTEIPGKKWTYFNPNGQISQIDFILINRVNSVNNCEPLTLLKKYTLIIE